MAGELVKELLNDKHLQLSSVVANSKMNRERQLMGPNSYQRELGVDVISLLRHKMQAKKHVVWLDICCGSGQALLQAAEVFAKDDLPSCISIVGFDLVAMFVPGQEKFSNLSLVESSVENWNFLEPYDLITCIHGLHYIGDKLSAIQKSVSTLALDGTFVASIDLQNFRAEVGTSLSRKIASFLRLQGFEYQSQKHLLKKEGQARFSLPFSYIGADDKTGPNYTGMDSVDSYYKVVK